jgi:hypothetical protein
MTDQIFSDSDKHKREFLAVQESIANHTVGILTDKGRGVGTGTLIGCGARSVILTANHVLKGNDASTLRIAFRHEGTLYEVPPRGFRMTPTAPLLSGERIRWEGPVTDTVNDIAALILDVEFRAPNPVMPYDMTDQKLVEVNRGASLFLLGFPVDNSIDVRPGEKAVGAISDHVSFDPSLNDLKGLPSSYDSSHQFLMKYSWGGKIEPHGLSGSGVWCGRNSTSQIWSPDPVLVGVVTDYLRSPNVLVVANLGSVLGLLSRLQIS